MDFFNESKDATEVVLQYAIRDILQGVERWIASVKTDAETEEFAIALNAAKMHRLIGTWRKKVAAPVVDEMESNAVAAGGAEATTKKDQKTWVFVGSVDWVFYEALNGVEKARDWIRALVSSSTNHSVVSSRLRAVVKSFGV